MKEKVYLAGSCRNVSVEERNFWRDYITTSLINNSKHLVAFNPNDHFSYEKNDPNDEKLVMDFFLNRLSKCSVMVVNLNSSNKSVGTGIEFGYALANNIFIIGYGTEDVYGYMKEKCSVVFKEVDEVAEFLLEQWG